MSAVTSQYPTSQEGVLLPFNGDIISLLQLPDSDKKVLAINLGNEYCIARVDGQFNLDASFGPNGTGYLKDTYSEDQFGFPGVASVSLKGDKLLVIGALFYWDIGLDHLALARYDSDGQVDTSFGENGKVVVHLPHSSTEPRQMRMQSAQGIQLCREPMVQADGKIVLFFLEVSSDYRDGRAFLIRLTAEGELDTSFNTQGLVHVTFGGFQVEPKGIWVQEDDKIVVYGGTQPDTEGTSTALIGRFNSDGSLDRSFNSTGYVTAGTDGVVSLFTALQMDDEGRILAIGNDGDKLLMIRRLADGQVDVGFNAGLPLVAQLPVEVVGLHSLVMQGDALLIAGATGTEREPHALLLRLLADGTVDTTFAEGSGYRVVDHESAWFDVVIENSGQIVTGGYWHQGGYVAWLRRFGIDG